MIDKKLNELSSFIDEVMQKDPCDFCSEYIKKIKQSVDENSKEYGQMNESIKRDVERFIDVYKKQGFSEDFILLHFFSVFYELIKKNAIHSYAYMIGLEPTLYKNEMRLLFKGKTR